MLATANLVKSTQICWEWVGITLRKESRGTEAILLGGQVWEAVTLVYFHRDSSSQELAVTHASATGLYTWINPKHDCFVGDECGIMVD